MDISDGLRQTGQADVLYKIQKDTVVKSRAGGRKNLMSYHGIFFVKAS
jgi:hypothetical protein